MPLPRSQTSASLSGSRRDDTPRRRASMYAQPQSAPISRSNSELSLHPPMRRRSLIQTPGVATRPHPAPTTARSTRSSLRHSHPPTPSMSRQPSTHFEETGRDFFDLPPLVFSKAASSETPGLATPREIDYSITGAFKFGTLRITNGSPILTPDPTRFLSNDIEKPKSGDKTTDYFVEETKCKADVTSEDLDTLVSIQSETKPQTQDADAAEEDSKATLQAVGEETSASLSIPVPEIGHRTSPVKNIQEEPSSPLITQSKQAAVDDDLFEDETEVSVPEVLDVRVDPSARSSTRQVTGSTQTPECVNRSDSGFVSKSKSTSSQSHNSLAKADSGYSSNVSLRSLRHGKKSTTREEDAGRKSTDSDHGAYRIQRSGSLRVLEIQIPSTAAVADSVVNTPQSAKAPTPPPKDDLPLKQSSRTPSGAMDVRANPTMPGRMRRKPLHQQPAAIDTSQTLGSQELKSSKPLPLSPASANSEGSSSSLSIANSSQKPGRLQRLLSLRNSSSSKQTYTTHETHSVDNRVPSVPKEVEAKLREHTGLYPMTNKRLALKSQMSKETLKTILSVGSLEYAKDDELPPTPAVFDREDEEASAVVSGNGNESSIKQTLVSMQSNFKTTAAYMISSKKSLTRKPVPAREPQTSVQIDSLGKEDSLVEESGLTSQLLECSGSNSRTRPSAALRPRRSLSMTTGHDHYLQMRTYSLDSRPTNIPNDTVLSSSAMSEEGVLLSKRRTSPPVSMETRTSFRAPPPRSPSRPQGPAVLRKESTDTVSRSVSHPAALASGRRFGHRGSVSGSQPDMVASQSYSSTWDSHSRHSSLNSQTASSGHSQQSSISSVRSDFVREIRSLQMYGQHHSVANLKRQSSLEGVGRNQLYGVYVPHSAQQGPSFAPQPHFDNPHGHWNPQNGRPMSGQLPWGAPPYVPRGHHLRNLSAGSRFSSQVHAGGVHAPYRILHSYNSPAYRNAPIWG